jgi:hypothetical protein
LFGLRLLLLAEIGLRNTIYRSFKLSLLKHWVILFSATVD